MQIVAPVKESRGAKKVPFSVVTDTHVSAHMHFKGDLKDRVGFLEKQRREEQEGVTTRKKTKRQSLEHKPLLLYSPCALV